MGMDPSSMAPRTACALLEVGAEATEREIAYAFKRLALRLHPDKNPTLERQATEAFQLITNAKDILMATPRPFFDAVARPFFNPVPEKQEKPRPAPETPPDRPEKEKKKEYGDLSMGAYFGVLGFWVCDVCDCQCLTLRELQPCHCGHKLKVHVENRCRQCHCACFTPKLRSSTCNCGHSSHSSVFTRTDAKVKTPHTARSAAPPVHPRRPFSARAQPPESGKGAHLPRAQVPRPPRKPQPAPTPSTSSNSSPEVTPRYPPTWSGRNHPRYGNESDATPETTPRDKAQRLDPRRRPTGEDGARSARFVADDRRPTRCGMQRGLRKIEEIRARLDARVEHFEELPHRMRRAARAAMSAR